MNKYLTGNYAPVIDEITTTDLQIIGTLPPELNGRYLRNGPNPIGDVDAQDFARGYVAQIKLPQRVPFGFHGNWVRDKN